MALSPNYGWAEPDNSSLVKNGAQDIRALGDAIDTSVWNVGYGQAGKNKIINGDFAINQRNFTSITTDSTYGFDRWLLGLSGGTGTYTPQTFTLGTAPVAGYEAKNFARLAVTTGNDYCRLQQRIESVRTFADQTVTISFWAKGTNPATLGSLNVTAIQNFGTGGSPSSSVITNAGSFTLTANWTRYSLTVAIPSIAGKTIGTSGGDNLDIGFGQGSNTSTDSWTLDLWAVQVEYGSKATPFQTATGTIQGELAACMRYFQSIGGNTADENCGAGMVYSTTNSLINTTFQVPLRTAPSVAIATGGAVSDFRVYNSTATPFTPTAFSGFFGSSIYSTRPIVAVSGGGLTAGNATILTSSNSNGKLWASAEL